MIFKMAVKAALFAGLVLVGLASYPALLSADESIEFFPPKNIDAGIGFLYFDAGRLGNKSVYAVPVQSDKLIAAVQQQTIAIMQQTEVVKLAQSVQCVVEPHDRERHVYNNNIVGVANNTPYVEIRSVDVNKSGGGVYCINVQTGQTCRLVSGSWACGTPPGYRIN